MPELRARYIAVRADDAFDLGFVELLAGGYLL